MHSNSSHPEDTLLRIQGFLERSQKYIQTPTRSHFPSEDNIYRTLPPSTEKIKHNKPSLNISTNVFSTKSAKSINDFFYKSLYKKKSQEPSTTRNQHSKSKSRSTVNLADCR